MGKYNKAIAGAAAPPLTVIVLWVLHLFGMVQAPPDMNEVAVVIATLIGSAVSAATVYFAPKNVPPS